jgi:hypothetical protein
LNTINRLLLVVVISFAILAYAADAKAFELRKQKSNAFNVAILDKPSVTQMEEMGYYRLNYPHKPFFDSVVIFAANINLRQKITGACKPQEYTDGCPIEPKYDKDPNQPCIYYNEFMQKVLDVDQGRKVISMLQSKEIKVQLGILNNHEWAGWSCKMEGDVIQSLAQQMVDEVVKYNLDGIMIDDEYSECYFNPDRESFYNLVKSIKGDSRFAGKIITMAVYGDQFFFEREDYNPSDLLDQVYEMSYEAKIDNLKDYTKSDENKYGMNKKLLGLGVWYGKPFGNNINEVMTLAQGVINEGYGGMMIYQPQLIPSFLETATYFSEIARAEYTERVFVYPLFPTVRPKPIDRIWRP